MPDRDSKPGRHRGAKGSRRKARSGRSKALRIAAWSAAGVVVLGGTGLGYVYFQLNGNIKSVDINSQLGTDRPQNVDNGSEDILVLGSDTRAGDNEKVGGGADEGSARSDTAMVVHVYKGHKKASIVSIPRDTLIDRPSCSDKDGNEYPAQNEVMFNSAYSTGGAACAVKTVESLSGIRMDHYVEVDFSGFQRLIDDLGGVKVTTTKAINDPDSHLNLTAGTHKLSGEQSLGLVRTRHGVGDGSDLGRIQLQQAFMKALMDQIKSVGVFTSPSKLYALANTATKTVTTDSQLASVKDLTSFASGLKGIGSGDMNMVTLPVKYDPNDANRVLLDETNAKKVWKALEDDKPVPSSATKDSAKGSANSVVK